MAEAVVKKKYKLINNFRFLKRLILLHVDDNFAVFKNTKIFFQTNDFF